MVLPLVYARTAIFDSTLTLCTTAAILWFAAERPTPAWAAMGVGALTKGPIALAIPLLALVPHALATGASPRRFFPGRGVGVFLLIALPWFIAVSIKIPEFPHYAFVRETLERVTTRGFQRTGPFWYYFPILPVAAFPWIVPALARLKQWRAVWQARRAPQAREPLLFASWVIVPLVFLTVNQSKLPQYVLPLVPAFALAAARNIATGGVRAGWRAYAALAAVLGVALVALTRWMPAPIDLTPEEKAAIPPTALALGVIVRSARTGPPPRSPGQSPRRWPALASRGRCWRSWRIPPPCRSIWGGRSPSRRPRGSSSRATSSPTTTSDTARRRPHPCSLPDTGARRWPAARCPRCS